MSIVSNQIGELKRDYNNKDGSRILMRDKHIQKLVRKANWPGLDQD